MENGQDVDGQGSKSSCTGCKSEADSVGGVEFHSMRGKEGYLVDESHLGGYVFSGTHHDILH